jgi:hypothetical protein
VSDNGLYVVYDPRANMVPRRPTEPSASPPISQDRWWKLGSGHGRVFYGEQKAKLDPCRQNPILKRL